ncbi:MAG: YoaK family protein [Candidatus Acidiferrales bacterium]
MIEAEFVDRYGPKMAVALLLTFASGVVDIVGYVGIFHFFAAHLTGTTVQLGRSLVDHDWVGLSAAGAIVGAFVAGSVLGRFLIEIGSRSRIRRVASVTLTIEALLLASLTQPYLHDTGKPYWGLAILAAAMGIQTATLTGIGPLTVHTTFVTGMVNKTAQLVTRIGFRAYDLPRSGSRIAAVRREQRDDIQMSLFLIGVWLFYVGGAAMGTWSFNSWGLRALFIAIGLLAVGFATDQFWPLSIKEEKEQSER